MAAPSSWKKRPPPLSATPPVPAHTPPPPPSPPPPPPPTPPPPPPAPQSRCIDVVPKHEPTFDDLHDATLESITFRWEHGEVVLSLRTGVEGWPRLLLIASGASLVVCPRREPWGHSVSINSVAASQAETTTGTKQSLSIEMQSGDTISVEAHFARLEGGERSSG